jgi:hypothetical protein
VRCVAELSCCLQDRLAGNCQKLAGRQLVGVFLQERLSVQECCVVAAAAISQQGNVQQLEGSVRT